MYWHEEYIIMINIISWVPLNKILWWVQLVQEKGRKNSTSIYLIHKVISVEDFKPVLFYFIFLTNYNKLYSIEQNS